MFKRLLLVAFIILPSTTIASPLIMVLGDSLSAAYGLEQKQGWVNLLSERLKDKHYPHQVLNASISGETTSGGLARIDAEFSRHQPQIVIIELGGNDGLRGLSLKQMHDNLSAIIEYCMQHQAKVLLIGMQLPPNYGPAYNKEFEGVYRRLADKHLIDLLPSLLDSVGNDKALFQADGIHPVAEAQTTLLDDVWQKLEPMLGATAMSEDH